VNAGAPMLGYCGLVTLAREELADLPEYSCSIPTGTTPGKRWKRDANAYRRDLPWPGHVPDWLLGEYVEIPGDPDHVGIRWRTVCIADILHP
jgi:hypothetical protein